jgi:hypothetical protein
LLQLYENKWEPIAEMHVEPGVQKAKALVVLTDIGGDPRILQKCAEAASFPTSDTANALARVYGQQCIGRMGDAKLAIPIMKKTWDEIDQSVAEHALFTLAQVGAKEVAQELLGFTTFDGFVAQCVSLDSRNKKEVCAEGSSQVRPPRVTALSRLAPGSMLPAFEKMLAEEKHEGLKKTITEGRDRVAAAADCDGKGEDCWIAKLKHENPRQRERAAYELVWSGTEKSIPALLENLADQDNEARFGAILAVWRKLPKEGAAKVDEILKAEAGKTQFVRINEDLKRLRIKLARGY